MTQTNNSTLQNENIQQYVEALVTERNFKDLEPEVIQQIKEDLADRVEEAANAAILASMPPAKLEEFDKILQNGSREEIAAFCEQNIPNLQEVVTQALRDFRKTYLGI
jgi:DNA-directed RNA polymerase subunit F